MPLHGKIVVIKRSGGDGTEFPLTATCLFGRKPDCDIRIQLPQVSKEHCRIDLNENKEIILTNLSSVNPTRVNGEALQQSERLKHGDVITVIDRSFRFEYPPAPTPKKRSSTGGKTETFKVLQDQQVGEAAAVGTGEKISEVSTDPHLKDGANHDNIQRSLEKTAEVASNDDSLLQSKTSSPFNDLYQMIKKSLDVKTPRKSVASQLQTPSSRFCTPKPGSVRKNDGKPVIFTEDKGTPRKEDVFTTAESANSGTPQSVRKQRRSPQVPSTEMAEHAAQSEATSPRRRNSATPQKFTVGEVIEQITAETPKSPMRRRSKEATPAKSSRTAEQDQQATASPKRLQKASPRKSGTPKVKEVSKKRKSGELGADLPIPKMKKKRVSFGGQLSPELFDKRLPPDSPLRKGATPRRSLSLYKPKQSLLRRASVIGLLNECDSPGKKSPAKMKTPSPKKSSSASPKTPMSAKKSPKSKSPSPKAATPAKKSPKSKSPSPKAATPAKKSPKSKSPSPKAATPAKKSSKSKSPSPKAATPAKKSPKSKSPSPKAETPATKSPKSRSPSPKAVTPAKKSPKSRSPSSKAVSPRQAAKKETPTPAKTPLSSRIQTPTVQGRFSVSRISTPSPVAETSAVTDQVSLVTVTPKIPLRRKSMKSASRKTPSVAKSAVKVIQRKSGISRASMKVFRSYADIVKFGQTKSQVVAPTKKTIPKKKIKKTVKKPQTPARKILGHVSTGHANSPVTIVLSRARKQMLAHPTGAAPRVVTNIALFKKNMKMDEDLTGISEMFKTPVNERKRRSVIKENSVTKTPAGGQSTSMMEPSVLNTPEEPGEMIVSPLSVACTVKGRRYNDEAVQRLLNGEESSFVSDIPDLEIPSESSEQQCADLKITSVTTPKQKPELPESLTGVKRLMKTPRQKAEPVEDLRGKLLKTPKQKPEQQDCLTGVKRIMKTPRQKAEPVEDLHGKLLKTPKQKPEQQECLTGVKRIFKTPKEKAEPVEDLRGKLLKTPKAPQTGDVSLDGVKELLETPAHIKESEDRPEMIDMKTPNTKSSPVECLTGVKRIMKTPKEKSAPVEDMVGVKRLMRTPREKGEPVEQNFGLKRLMKSPRPRGGAPVEDFEGLQELMEEPPTDPRGQVETNEDEEQMPVDDCVEVAKELDFACGEPQDSEPSDITDVTEINAAKEADANEVVVDDHLEVSSGHTENETSDAMETISPAAADEIVLPEQPRLDTVEETLTEVQPEVETSADKITEMDTAATDLDQEKKPVRGRRAKAAQDEQKAPEPCEEPVVSAPVRGRRGKKTEATAPPAGSRSTRGRNAKAIEIRDVEAKVEETAPQPSEVSAKPRRGRNAKKPSDVQTEMLQEVIPETETVPESKPVDVEHKEEDGAAPLEKAVSKPKRGRKIKQPEQSVSEQQDVLQADVTKDANEDCSDQLEVLPGGTAESESSDATETVLSEPEPQTETSPDVEAESCKATEVNKAVVQKKPVRGRRGKRVEFKEADDKQEAAEPCDEPVAPTPIRGRRGKKTEAAAPPAGRQRRGRNTKSEESTSDETHPMTEVSTEMNTSKENDSVPPAEETVVKPVRGRKTKPPVKEALPQPETNEVASDEQLIPPTAGKPRRGRKTKPDTAEQHEVVEDTAVTLETSQQPQQPVRAKRGRNAKVEEEKISNNDENAKSLEPAKKVRRTRKPEQDSVEPTEECQTTEMVVPEAEVPPAQPVAAKPRRGGRKAKQDTESVESPEVQEASAVGSTDKPKRGKRGKQATEEVEVTVENPEPEVEAEERTTAESAAPASKPSKGRGVKTSVKTETSKAVPAKRARRGALLPPPEESSAESTVLVPEPAPTTEPVKRGRRATAKATAKLVDAPKDANKTEEDDLSGKVVEAQPVKRARRGAKAGDVTADKAESTTKVDLKDSEAETQPKTRRGRTAKK